MKSNGTITTFYRAEVVVPNDVYEQFGHTEEYDRFVYGTSNGLHCGQMDYDCVTEWVESASEVACENFVAQWDKKISEWKTKLLDNE